MMTIIAVAVTVFRSGYNQPRRTNRANQKPVHDQKVDHIPTHRNDKQEPEQRYKTCHLRTEAKEPKRNQCPDIILSSIISFPIKATT